MATGWALVAAIVWLSLTPQPPELQIESGDKVGHLVAYGAAMFWFCQLYRGIGTRVAYAAGFIALGIALEFAQGALGYRTQEVADMYADALGVLLGWAVAIALPSFLK